MDLFVLKKIKEGDIKAFESIFRLYYTPLCLYATSITGELEVAEEIVQDLFYVFWKERESLPILRSINIGSSFPNSSFCSPFVIT